MYRRTRKYNDERKRQTQATRERNRVESAAPGLRSRRRAAVPATGQHAPT